MQVDDPAGLARVLGELFADKPRRVAMGAAAAAFAARHRGATGRTVAVLTALFDDGAEIVSCVQGYVIGMGLAV